MAWFFIVAAGLGLGFVFRVPAVLTFGTGLFAASVAMDIFHGTLWSDALLSGFLKLAALEGAYVAGLLLRRLLPARSGGGTRGE